MRIEEYIKIPYTTVPQMQRFEGELLSAPPLEKHLREKQKELSFLGQKLWFQSDIAYHHKLIGKACLALGLEKEVEVTKLGLKIQEDIVIVHRGKLEAAFVAFPSGWKPGEQQGKTLKELHQPVADGNDLRRMSDRITQLMCSNVRFHRGVWTLTSSELLSAYPDYTLPEVSDVNDLWLRTEHQKSFCIEEGLTSGFLIDVHLTPFWLLSENIKENIKKSINSMTDSVLVYKRLSRIKELLGL